MSESSERDARHKARMQRKKAVVDEKIAEAQDEYGLLLVHTGNGKGKSSSAFGMVARALGHGIKVGVVQFIKGAASTGEESFFRRFPDEVRYHVMGEGFTWETQDRERDQQLVEEAWRTALGYLRDGAVKLVLLDELNVALKLGYIDAETVIAGLNERPELTHVAVTGRGAPAALVERADLVTEMTLVHHPFREQGVKAQAGIEY